MDRAGCCFELAREAARILAACRGHVATEFKGDRDPVTDADRASERFLVEELAARFPEDGFLGEEGTSRPGSSGYLWVADPLDGTVNFSHGNPHYAVSLALLREGRVLAGAVAHGASGELFTAERGAGAFRNGERLRVSGCRELHLALAATDFPYDQEARLGRGVRRMESLLLACQGLRIQGSAALELCRIAAGELDLYAGDGTRPWDVAAGLVILEEAGGRATTWTGQELDMADPRFPLATNGALHMAALRVAQDFLL